MNKKSALWIILDLVFLIVFNTVFFVAGGFEHPASVWLSYGFIHFAYLMVIATPFLIRKSSSAAVFGFSLYSISSTYFLVEFIVGLIFVFLRQESVKAALIVQVIIAGIYAQFFVKDEDKDNIILPNLNTTTDDNVVEKTADENPDLWICGCGQDNKGKFCVRCGKPKTAAEIKEKYCPNCGKIVPEGSNFCGECGMKVK